MNWRDAIEAYFPSGPAGAPPWRDDLQWEYVASAAVLVGLLSKGSRRKGFNILKTDAHNEFAGKPCPGGVAGVLDIPLLLEVDSNVASDASQKGFHVRPGSILALVEEFGPNLTLTPFDLILDCSTLDHVDPDLAPKALREYYAALSPNVGCLLLFVWESQDPADIDKAYADALQPYGPNHQFYFKVWEPQKWAHAAGFKTLSRTWWLTSPMRQMTRYIFVKE